VLLKRGMAASIEEWLMAAEYILASGNPNVILCERGFAPLINSTPVTPKIFRLSLFCALWTHLPIMVDPSHGVGRSEYVPSMAAAVAVGADGLIIEVHP